MELSGINSPEDIKGLDAQGLDDLARQLRERIVEVVSENGGHLSSNLGAVELTIALHRAFSSPQDKLVFDVGHQCYAHKMLTGRAGEMDSLRRFGGVSGFPRVGESAHDAYGTGHASTSISAALGLARARDLRGGSEHVVAVVGDGALTGGLCYEALNDAGSSRTRLIVVLNDNQMSIAPNVGAVSKYLTYMRTAKAWDSAKRGLTAVLPRIPLVGGPLLRLTRRVKDSVRNFLIRDRFFDAFGFRYLGPMDGHNIAYMEKIFNRAKRLGEPVLIHVVTQKGRGYGYAEREPGGTHGVNPFNPVTAEPLHKGREASFGAEAGKVLCELAQADRRVVAVTAAMAEATGLGPFQERFPDRLFDVGIAESHAVTLAAGMARGGMWPVVALYDTFLQRAYDQAVVDVCLQGLPVTFLVDRAAMGADGPTHHGVFGATLLRHIPGATLLHPRSIQEMGHMLRFALGHDGPVFIRYARYEDARSARLPCAAFTPGRWETLAPGGDLCLVATGTMAAVALEVRDILKNSGISAGVVNASTVKPLDDAFLMGQSASGVPYFVLEEQVLAGGLGSAVLERCVQNGWRTPDRIFAVPDAFIPHGSHAELLRWCGLDADSVAGAILAMRKASLETAG